MGVYGPASAAGGGLGPSTGSGRTGLGGARAVGSGGVGDATGVGGGGGPARRTSGYRLSPVRRWGCAGTARAAGGGRVGLPVRRDGRFAKRPYGGGSGARGGWGVPRPAHLWIPAFAGTTMAGVRVSECCWCRAGGPALAGRALREAPLRRGVGVGSAKGVGDGGAPPIPLWIPAFAGMTREGGPLRQAQGERIREAPLWWGVAREGGVPACAGATGGGVGGGRGMPTTSAARKTGRP